MNVLGISGSPNPDGNTAYAVRYALDIVRGNGPAIQYISLSGRVIYPCTGCWSCSENRECVRKDGMDEIYDAMRWCDCMIIGSPVYFGMVSGHLKVMMDRCVALRPVYDMPMALSGKTGCGIACGGFRNGGQETTLQNIHTFLLQQNMKVINDGFGYSHAGGTIVGSARDDTLGLKTVENLANNLLASFGPG